MKGAKLWVAILTPLALFLGIIMAAFGFNESWSQNHGTPYDPFLYLTLFFIAVAFIKASSHHPDKERQIIKYGKKGKKSVRLKHMLGLTCLFFGGVMAFGVNSPITWVAMAHLIFTGLGIGTGYAMIVTYPETKKGKLWAHIGFALGVAGFLGGFIFHFYSIAWAEVLATIPFVIWMFTTWIFKKVLKES